jgi:hypothetical protein
MKRLFTEIFKLSLFIGLILAAAYLTGNWDKLMRLLAQAQIHVTDLADQIKGAAKTFL